MSYTTTTRLGLVKPTPGTAEPVNVATQLNASMDRIDDSIGAKPCTSSTRPSSPYDGQFIRETDTGRLYVYSATASAWLQIMGPGVYLAAPGGSTGSMRAQLSSGTATGNRFLDLRGPSDANPRYIVDWDGNMQWGGGTSGADVNLYRSAADTLKTDDKLVVGNGLQLGATAAVAVTASETGAGGVASASSSFASGSPSCGVAFVAPPSGKCLINWSAEIAPTTTSVAGICSIQVKNGGTLDSGTVVLSPSDDYAVRSFGIADRYQMGLSYLLTGLTSGNSYNVMLQQRGSTSTTVNFYRRRVIVTPQL